MSIEGLTFLVGLMIVGYGCYMACVNRFISRLSDRVTKLEEQLKKSSLKREQSSITPNDSNRINYGDSIYSQATHDWLDWLDKNDLSDEQIEKAIRYLLEDSKDTHK